jgi:hypothetical protein
MSVLQLCMNFQLGTTLGATFILEICYFGWTSLNMFLVLNFLGNFDFGLYTLIFFLFCLLFNCVLVLVLVTNVRLTNGYPRCSNTMDFFDMWHPIWNVM